MRSFVSYRHSTLIFSAVFIAVGAYALFLSFNGASAAVTYLSFDAENETVGSDLTNPPFCQTQCGESYEVGKIGSAGGAPQGINYFQWHIANLQHSVYNIVHNPSTFPVSPPLGSTVYLAYYFNYSRINGADIWHETDDSADKGIEINGSGLRWIVSPGHWGSLANNQDHRYTVWMGNPTYHLNSIFEGNPYWTVVPPNQNGYSAGNPPQLEYERWYSAVMAIKIAANNTGFVALYLDGVKILEWNDIITSANSAPTIEHITMGGTLAQPAYDAPEHYRKYDALILTDNWQDIVSGGYLASAPVDTIAPSIPTALTAAAISASRIDLSWVASTDNTGVAGYKVFRNGTQIATVTTTAYSDADLTASTAYTYIVSAYDATGNNSIQSTSASTTTQPAPVIVTTIGAPVLHFSDLTSGPKTGNTDGIGSGAIVSIWGNNLGSLQGSSQVYVGGVPASHIYYWGNADGSANAGPADLYTMHTMQTVSFAVPAGAPDGSTNIQVMVNGVQSNTLSFTVRTGNIYFIKTGGNNANAGSWQSPWGTLMQNGNSKMTNGDVLYVVGTLNATGGADGLLLKYNGLNNTAERPAAIIGYPGSSVYLSGSSNGIGAWNSAPYPQYWIFSKLKVETGSTGISSIKGMRAVANEITGPLAAGQSGAISGSKDSTSGVRALGNYIHDFGLNDYSIRLHHVFYLSNRDGTPNEAYELGWNYLLNNHARGGLHNYDEGVCGDFTGVIKVHDNAVVNQSGTAFDVGGSGGGYDGTGCLKVPFEVYNNVFVNAGQAPFSDPAISVTFSGTKSHIKFYNNIIYGWSGTEAVYIQDNGSATWNFGGTFEWVNNIVVDTNNLPYSHPVYYKIPSVHSNNIWYNGGDGNPAVVPVWDIGALSADPSFISPSTNNFHLQSASPAINAGSASVSTVVTRDIEGIARPQGSAYDIGAYEYASGYVAPPAVVTPPPASAPPAVTPALPTPTYSPAPVPSTSGSASAPAPSPTSGGSASTQPSTNTPQAAQAPASASIAEGSLIRGPDHIKVYIVNAHGYKRHIFNPAIFSMYGHFRWDAIKEVSQQTLDSYITSDLYRADGDTKVFSLKEIDESKGLAQKQWFNISGERFIQKGYTFTQVFIINPTERDYYQEGTPITQ